VIATWLPSGRGMQHDDQVGPVPSLAALVVPPQDARSGMSARSRNTKVCINIQGTLAIMPWMPMMAERWRRDESAK
jgi:hypothetical protein